MTYLPYRDFALEVQKGNVAGHTAVNKFGRNGDVDTAEEDIWVGGGIWVAPTTARTHDIVSTDANDDGDPAGTDAQTVKIYGLDASWALQEESVTLNGTSNVATASTYLRIHRMVVTAAGSGGVNAGTITATAQTDATVTAQIGVGDNQTFMAIYTIPASKTGYMQRVFGDLNTGSGSSVSAELRVLIRPNATSEPWQPKQHLAIMSEGTSNMHHPYSIPLKIEAQSDIKIAATGSTNNLDICAGFDLILVDD